MRKMHIFLIFVIIAELTTSVYLHRKKIKECEDWAEKTGYFLVDPCDSIRWDYEKGN